MTLDIFRKRISPWRKNAWNIFQNIFDINVTLLKFSGSNRKKYFMQIKVFVVKHKLKYLNAWAQLSSVEWSDFVQDLKSHFVRRMAVPQSICFVSRHCNDCPRHHQRDKDTNIPFRIMEAINISLEVNKCFIPPSQHFSSEGKVLPVWYSGCVSVNGPGPGHSIRDEPFVTDRPGQGLQPSEVETIKMG